jgi:hypothetical protein
MTKLITCIADVAAVIVAAFGLFLVAYSVTKFVAATPASITINCPFTSGCTQTIHGQKVTWPEGLTIIPG